ncbi:MAG: DUF4398 domain-containing protein [Pseudobdellovibrionaceae bacterium]
MRGLVIIVITLMMLTVRCQSIPQPIEEYTLARVAIEAARAVQAPRHSPGYWHQADEAYRQGRLSYKDRDYAKAREAFIKARLAAEKAENSARLIRQKTGDVL